MRKSCPICRRSSPSRRSLFQSRTIRPAPIVRSAPVLFTWLRSLLLPRHILGVVPAKAGTYTLCPGGGIATAETYREAGGYGSPPSRGRRRNWGALAKQNELAHAP